MSDNIARLFILLAIGGSIFVISQLVLNMMWSRRSHARALNQRLSLIKQGFKREEVIAILRKNQPRIIGDEASMTGRMSLGIQRVLAGSAVNLTLGQFLMVMGALFLVTVMIVLILVGLTDLALTAGVLLLAVALATCVGILLPLMVLSSIATRRRKRVEDQFPIALDVFVRALKAGHPIASALNILTQEMEDPIGSEFGLVSDEVSYGSELTEALAEMAERWDSDDIRMFVVSLTVQNETGGNLAEILQNLSEVIRARASLYRKVRALSSEGRMTGWLLTALPLIAFVGMFTTNPEFYLSVAQETSFLIGFVCLMAMYAMGVFMIRRLVDIKV